MASLMRGLRRILRSLRRTPGFTATVVLTLALGIGLSVAVFTVAEALLLRRLPFREPGRLVVLWGLGADRVFETPLGLTDARAFARRTRTLERTAFFEYEGTFPASIQDGDRITRLNQAVVSGEFFEVLGGRPLLGRALNAEDDRVGAARVAVLSHAAWLRHFGGRSDILDHDRLYYRGPGYWYGRVNYV